MFRVAALVFVLSAGQPLAAALVFVLGAGQPLAAALTAPPAAPAQASASVDDAQSLLAAGNDTAAVAVAEQVVARDPFNVEAHHIIQLVYRRQRNDAALINRYRGIAERYPGSAAAQYLLGNALLSTSGSRSAQQYFDRALELDPRFGWAASINAIFQQMAGNPAEAIRLGRISAEAIINDVGVAAVYADILRLNGLRDEALRYLQTAAALNPQEPRYLIELWKMWTRGVENIDSARAQFAADVYANRTRFLDTPEHAAMFASFLAGAAWADSDASRDVWLALADRFPDAPGAKDALLRVAGYTKDVDEKIAVFNRILEAYPDSPIRYTVYERLIRWLINEEAYDRAKRTARGLTAEIDPGRGDADDLGPNERSTQWGFTLEGIGYAGWFAAAQAEADAGGGGLSVRAGRRIRRDQPISPQALLAARALDTSGCADPRALEYVGRILLNSSLHRALGIRLVERAVDATGGAYPLMELAYGAGQLERARDSLERLWRDMPYYYAEAGMLREAEGAVEELLASLTDTDTDFRHGDANYLAGYVYERVGRYRDAARHYLVGFWYQTTTYEGFEEGLASLYGRLADNEIHRFAPDGGRRMPLAAAGIRPVGGLPLDGETLGGELLLVVFFGRWNESSIAQVEMLDEMAASLADQGVSVLAVAPHQPARPIVREREQSIFTLFLRDHPVDIPLARAELETIDRLDLVGLPTTFLLDAGGRMLARQLSFGIEPGAWAMAWRDVIDAELERIGRTAAAPGAPIRR